MKIINFLYFSLAAFFLTVFLFTLTAQVENSSNYLSIDKEPPNLLLPKKNIPLIGKDFLDSKPIDIKDPNINFTSPNIKPEEKFIDPGKYYLSKIKNPENKKNPKDFRINQYLGDFKNNGEFVEIIFRDHEYFDGDRIQILVNDNIIVQNVLLEQSFKMLNMKLQAGFNKIDFLALNQGESGPNTAEVRAFNDKGELITSNQWNLATGVKATLIIVKE
ncbi:MAG: hypothetical protein P8M03_06145 [Flavobacteriaceae bacterium]|nr:hypothetical protein [Flavobacteriaceae bacterium]|tara:strand:- start:96 stop:749 length:654 start_codon:yes stop_codon:yes gene_type:complete